MTQEYQFINIAQFNDIANGLPRAEERPIFWEDPADDGGFEFGDGTEVSDVVEIDVAKAVYAEETGELFGVVSDEYHIINPDEFLLPLVDEVESRDRGDPEGTVVTYEGGARGYGEMLFDSDAIWPPDRNRSANPVRTGLTFRYSHDGGISVRASGFAQDGMCVNTMRRVTDAVYVKHAGHVEERVDWRDEWSSILDQLGVFSESLAAVIDEAFEFQMFDLTADPFSSEWVDAIDVSDTMDEELARIQVPLGVEQDQVRGLFGFYDYLGFPRYLSHTATGRTIWRLNQRSESVATAWDVYSGMTFALSHEARFNPGSSSDDRYHRIASDILSNPTMAMDRAMQGFNDRLAVEDDTGALDIEFTTGEAVQTFKERDELLRSSFQGE